MTVKAAAILAALVLVSAGCSGAHDATGSPASGSDGGPLPDGSSEGAAAPDAPSPRDAGCDRELTRVKTGCVETEGPPTVVVDGDAGPGTGYTCSTERVDSVVRIRACVSRFENAC